MLRKIFMMVILSLLLVQSVHAAGQWQLLTAKMVIRTNLTGDMTTVTRAIGIRNTDNESVAVELRPTGEIKDMVTLDEENLILQQDEERWINFTLELKESGTYGGDIMVVFTSDKMPSAALASVITVVAKEGENTTDNNPLDLVTIGVIISILVIFIIGYKWWKK